MREKQQFVVYGTHGAEPTKGSWWAEIILVVVLGTCVLAWVSSNLARQGFDVIETLSDRYQNIVYVTILARLGLKGLDKFFLVEIASRRAIVAPVPTTHQAYNLKVVGSNPTPATK